MKEIPHPSAPPRKGVPWRRVALVWIAVAAAGGMPRAAGAQVAAVPVRHPVYAWLRYQDVLGHVDGFDAGALPLYRTEIVAFLDQVGRFEPELSGADRDLLRAFRQELSLEGLQASARESYVKGEGGVLERLKRLHTGAVEPRLYAEVGEGYAYAVDMWRTAFGQRDVWEGADREHEGTRYDDRGIRAFATFGGHFGFHLEAGNVVGKNRLLALDPVYGRTFEVLVQGKDNSLYTEAIASAMWKGLSADIGHGTLRFGRGEGASILLGPESSMSDWVRLRAASRRVEYTLTHASLAAGSAPARLAVGGDTLPTKYAPQRWMTVHRLALRPIDGLHLGFSQVLVTSRRDTKWEYLTPLAPLTASSAEENGDNLLWGMEARARLFPGLSVWGGLVVDDFGDQGKGKAYDVGIQAGLPGGVEAEARAVRVDPFLYTSPDTLDALQQRGFVMGYPLGANAEEVTLKVRKWLPHRSWISIEAGRGRKGLDPLPGGGGADGEAGQASAGIGQGGSFLFGPGAGRTGFLENADVQEFNLIRVEAVGEPLRGVQLGVRFSRRSSAGGERWPDEDRSDVWLRIESPVLALLSFFHIPFLSSLPLI